MGNRVEQFVFCEFLEALKELVIVIACAVYEEAPRLLVKCDDLIEGRSGIDLLSYILLEDK
jgi:hypothetical protein